jgi:MoxR-like ATPase
VVKVEELLDAIEEIRQVYVSAAIQRYIIDLVGRTRQSGDVYLGASPRGSLALFRAGQARAALHGRDHVLPDDIKALAVPVLGHRVIVSPAARLRELSADRIVQEIVYTAPVPGGDYQASAAAEKVKVKAQ